MKTTITILIITAVTILITVLNSEDQSITEVAILNDITDSQIARPDTQEILALFNLQNKWNGGVFQYTDLTDVSYNQTKQAKLESRNKWLSNEFEREKEIKKFKNEITNIINNEAKDKPEKPNSSIYFPIAKELNKLKNSQSQKRILIIYSDLTENTENLSFYKKNDFELLKTKPGQIKEIFEKQITMNSLNGIEIYIIYQPKENNSDQKFQTISGFYKKLLEEKGAKVKISANL